MLRTPALEHWRGLLALCLCLLGFQQGLSAAAINAKAWMAPLLLERAWKLSLAAGGGAVRPWPWADTWPVARLSAPTEGVELVVLAGDTGNSLAFGPGLAPYSSLTGEEGISVLAGHRDTHFSFLPQLRTGDELSLETAEGTVRRYTVQATRVVDSDRESIVLGDRAPSLLLVTCYPFDTVRVGGPLRYVVYAVPLPL